MFDTITIKESKDFYFDLGCLAESLLFYKEVIFLCSPKFFETLVFSSCREHFLELMYSKQIAVKIEDNIFAINHGSPQIDVSNWFKPILVKGQNVDAHDRVERAIFRATGKRGLSRRFSRRVIENSEIILHPQDVIKYIFEDLEDDIFLKRSIYHTLKLVNHQFSFPPESIQIEVKKIYGGFTVNSNIDYDKLKQEDVSFKNITEETVVFNIMQSRIQSTFASNHRSDLSTTETISKLIEEKVSSLMRKSIKNQDTISSFSKMTLEGKMIKNVIHKKEQKFEDFIKTLEKANKFKEWLNDINSEDLLAEYYRKVTEKTLIDKLPCKTVRWSIFTGLGLLIDSLGAGGLGTVSGAVIGAGDTFILDKLIGGWKPNSFVDSDLKKFIKN
jgi:hypothetical protein